MSAATTTSLRKRALDRAADLLVEHGLRANLGDDRGIMVGTAICRGLTEAGIHDAGGAVCRQLMTEVAGTLDCSSLREARVRFSDMTAEQWATRLRAVGRGRLS